ncbi:pseudaminic acid synthase [Helicobacter mustelae]|uniref:Pseudaminic acid synthase n=1 Tax=Helicobacter mustelae (strain ATCC 43772 / CCUG 25715 / CIP 103759 / LMG 18044 / NCTC 12198 / R85-136P) TaxID=679897 RepID=D3UIV0_HELM1|nr:pseudaminic acid synthase [Helicobacter mustelae]CBG40425.1 N-acetylneuraminic acid synthetase [Helicobacter mustelae 12198]SQH71925.1 N-acetylneuraminic acid synthetase [Helicobacter mustelae]STP13066.1 N-acetylneuraminic acid synthetase [Helicobacter mustelae]
MEKLTPSIPLLVAEISANHKQDLLLAKRHMQAAKHAGAHAIKIQTYRPSCLTLDSRDVIFRIEGDSPWEGRYLYDLYAEACLPWEWHGELFAYAKEIGIELFSSPFSLEALELLESLNCPRYKIASFECIDPLFIYEVASTKKPIVLSTGIALEEEIKEALEMCEKAGNSDITLLQCTSSYPAPLKEANLLAMQRFGEYGVKFGLSDHTLGSLCAIIAAVLGASMIEKHFILERSLGGVDSSFSMEAEEFAQMAAQIQDSILALGDPHHKKTLEELRGKRVFARSLFVKKPIKKGERFTRENIGSFRPNHGMHPRFFSDILGRRASRDLEFAKPLLTQDICKD